MRDIFMCHTPVSRISCAVFWRFLLLHHEIATKLFLVGPASKKCIDANPFTRDEFRAYDEKIKIRKK